MDERHVAAYLNLCPSHPLEWPVSLLRRLLAIYQHEGRERFALEIYRLLVR